MSNLFNKLNRKGYESKYSEGRRYTFKQAETLLKNNKENLGDQIFNLRNLRDHISNRSDIC